jgi:hypothetical protein
MILFNNRDLKKMKVMDFYNIWFFDKKKGKAYNTKFV